MICISFFPRHARVSRRRPRTWVTEGSEKGRRANWGSESLLPVVPARLIRLTSQFPPLIMNEMREGTKRPIDQSEWGKRRPALPRVKKEMWENEGPDERDFYYYLLSFWWEPRLIVAPYGHSSVSSVPRSSVPTSLRCVVPAERIGYIIENSFLHL